MKIIVLISTLNDGILSVPDVLLPATEGVQYVVSWQQDGVETCPQNAPAELNRKDVILTTMQGRGLCRNRNQAMSVALHQLSDPLEDAVFVVADDDERLDADAFAKIRELYGQHERLDIALLRVRNSTDGSPLKSYPPALCSYHSRPRSYYVSSVEMTFRSRVCYAGLRFDERFGLGSPKLCAGEEDVFLFDALQKGLQVLIAPIDLCRTDGATTGSRPLDVKVLRSKGAVYGYTRSWPSAFVRSCRESLSLAVRHRVSAWQVFHNIWYGVKYIRS